MKAEITDRIKQINSLRRPLVSSSDANQQAKFQYMSKSGKKLFRQFQDTKSRRDNLQKFFSDFENISDDFNSSSDFQEIKNASINKIYASSNNFLKSILNLFISS